MAPTLLPLNIVTPSGFKSRTYAPPNASLADLRSILIKDAIIKPSTKFYVDSVVISGSAEVHMQWTEIIREIHVGDGEVPSVYHAFNSNLNVSGNSSRPQPYPSPSHTPALDEPKELAQIPSFIERPVDHNAHDSVCEGDLKPDCEDSRDCEASDESRLCSSPTTCQAPCDPPKDCAAEGPHRPCDQDFSGEDCAQAEPCSARGNPAAIEASQKEQDGDQQECEPYSDRPCESPNVAEGDLENDGHEEAVSSCNDRAPACEDGGSNSKFRPLRLSVDGSVLKGKVVFEKPQTPRDSVFDGSSTPSASGPRRAPSRSSSATKVGFSVDMGVQPQTEWYQSDEYCGYGLPVIEQFNKPTVIRSQSRFPAQDDERTVMMSDLQDTTQTRVPAERSRSDTVFGGGILDTTIGASVQAGGNAKAEVGLSTGGGIKFGLGFASHSTSMTMDSRLQVDESWRQRLDIVNTVKTVMQVGCTDRARFASAFGGLEIDADLFQLGAATVVSASSETQQLTASINDPTDDGIAQVTSGVSDSSPCSSPSVSTISIDQNAAVLASDKQSTWSDCGELSVTSATSHTESDTSALAKVPLYRLYAPSLPDHFYTTNAAERDACTGYGYTLESTAAQVLASPSPEGRSVPFFRIYRNKEHFYTADVVEKQRVVGWAGTRDEGIAGYVYPDRRVGTVPLYRLYNPGSDDHFYTTSAPEKEVCTKSGQWNDEGVACYVYP